VVEAAVVVVDAVAGVQVQTEKVWKFASEFDLPRAIVVNRLDRERADFSARSRRSAVVSRAASCPSTCPSARSTPSAVTSDLVKQKAITYADGKATEGSIPADLTDAAREAREKLVEAAAETDDDLLSKYLDEGALDEAEMLKALRTGIADGKVIPVLCAAASKSIGATGLLDLVVEAFPLTRRPSGDERAGRQDQAAGHALGHRDGPRVRAGVQDVERSPRRQAVAVPRLQRHAEERFPAPEPRAREQGAHGPHLVAHGQEQQERGRSRSRRDRRGGQAQGDADG
jgi:elongation factor G